MRLTKAQLEARKKRRERNKPIRQWWKKQMKLMARQYNATGEIPRVHAP